MGKCKVCNKNCVNEYCFQHKPRKPLSQKKQSLEPQKPLKRVSDKRKKEEALYFIAKKEYVEKNPNCEICGRVAQDLHHRKGRSGSLLYDKRYFMSVCRDCHQYEIHENPINARSQGWLI